LFTGIEKLLKQRVYMLIQGYEDTNEVFHLQKICFSKIYFAEIWLSNLLCADLRTVSESRSFLICIIVEFLYAKNGEKHQHFFGFAYQAATGRLD